MQTQDSGIRSSVPAEAMVKRKGGDGSHSISFRSDFFASRRERYGKPGFRNSREKRKAKTSKKGVENFQRNNRFPLTPTYRTCIGWTTMSSNLVNALSKLGGAPLRDLPSDRIDPLWDQIKEEFGLSVLELSALKNHVLVKSLLQHGLPKMIMSGSRTDGSASKSHSPADCIVKPFGLLQRSWNEVDSSLYRTMKNQRLNELTYSSESDIQGHVKNLLSDIIGITGLEGIQCLNELSIFGHRADIWLILKVGKPIGVVEIKKPGRNILWNGHELGQLYNYMLRLWSFFGVEHVFGVATTYAEWRICWLKGAEQSAAFLPNPYIQNNIDALRHKGTVQLFDAIATC